MDLDVIVMINYEYGKILLVFLYIFLGNDKVDRDFFNVFGVYNSFVENKKEQDLKSFLFGFFGNEYMYEVFINNVSFVLDGIVIRQLFEFGKVENLRINKLIFDFGSMIEINERFLDNVQYEIVFEGFFFFLLWVELICVVDN